MENQKNENGSSAKEEKISSDHFFKELDILLKKAPENVIFFVTATEDPEDGKETGTAVFSLQGKAKHIVWGLTSAYRHDRRFKEIGYRAVSAHRMMDSMLDKNPFELLAGLGGLSALAEILKK